MGSRLWAVYLGGAACANRKLACEQVLAVLNAYTEVLDLVEDLIVESEVIAWDGVDAGLLLDVPVLKTESLGLSKELGLGELSAPVCLSSFFQLTVCSHAGETKNRSVADNVISMMKLKKTEEGICRGKHVRLNHDRGWVVL